MRDTIFMKNSENKLVSLSETLYQKEEHLQEIIANNPVLLAGEQINPDEPRKWILISREMGVPNEENGGAFWSIDHLFLDQDGIPTLVEVKRSTDTHIRREVVGQMLDYASSGSLFWKVEDMQKMYTGDLCSDLGLSQEQCDNYNYDNQSKNYVSDKGSSSMIRRIYKLHRKKLRNIVPIMSFARISGF